MDSMIQINNLKKTYSNGFNALKGININIEKGKFFGLLGPNGAGKTTTIGILTGLVNLTSGNVLIDGYDVIKDYKITRRMIGLSPQEINLDVFFTIKELLTFQGGYFGLSLSESKKRVEKLLYDLGLEDKVNAKARELSGGMKRRVQIAKALVHDPELIILDEPTAGVDIELRHLLWNSLKEMNIKQNKTLLLTTHYIEEAEALCDEVAIIDDGKIIAQGSPKELIKADGESYINITVNKINENILSDYNIDINENIIKITSKNPEKDIPNIINILSESNIAVRNLNVKTASLEDVFLKLTGKNIIDD
ncbi:MAG: ABC transporter ATP-binding protein [Candidatus Marinimicrobia bacterium]|nr:ABC transporter ATP-binding protein [Candidatus Neomarinimicrobiota bacterium]|tara:strand:- start:24253 stop:25176 length:924 start_codon:yes stop_codon:yes gene_type:complete